MSRPATAAQSNNRTHSVESRANLRRSISAIPAGMCPWSCQLPCATSNLVSSRTKKGLPPLRRHICPLTLAATAEPAITASLDIGRTERRERELLRAAGQLTELVRRFPVPVRTEQQHPAR